MELADTEESLRCRPAMKNMVCKVRVPGRLETCRVNNPRVVSISGGKTR